MSSVVALTLLSGCDSGATPAAPQLISAATIAPGTRGALLPTPTLTDIPSVTPTITFTPTPTIAPTDTEVPSDTDLPTDTPSATFTATRFVTATPTPRPTRTKTPSASPPTDTPMPCTVNWFFAPRPSSCPMTQQVTGTAAFRQFEHGFMIWFGPQSTIFVGFNDKKNPRWQQFEDAFTDGMPDSDPTIVPPPGLFQPTRGIGLVWRGKAGVRDRLGWATTPEQPYLAAIQVDLDGNRYVLAPQGQVYELAGNFKSWRTLQ